MVAKRKTFQAVRRSRKTYQGIISPPKYSILQAQTHSLSLALCSLHYPPQTRVRPVPSEVDADLKAPPGQGLHLLNHQSSG